MTKEEKYRSLAVLIKAGMDDKGLTPQQFGKMMGVTTTIVHKWLSGTHNFEIKTLFDIEEKLNIALVL